MTNLHHNYDLMKFCMLLTETREEAAELYNLMIDQYGDDLAVIDGACAAYQMAVNAWMQIVTDNSGMDQSNTQCC